MSLLLYQLFLKLYALGVRLAALSSPKAKAWLKGRQHWRSQLVAATQRLAEGPRIWLHAASLGEFEQGRPVLEQLKKEMPDCRVIVSFFSPSGYWQQKNYKGADLVCYLPLDGAKNATDFIELIRPDAAIFVKYEFWYYYLRQLHASRIPTLLLSAAFRENQPFFKWYGGFFRKMLHYYNCIQVQDEKSKQLLAGIGVERQVATGGDTRYDRVLQIAATARTLNVVEVFKGNSQLLIAGSTWPKDEKLLAALLPALPGDWKMIVAPHEIGDEHIQALKKLFGNHSVCFSEWSGQTEKRALIIDNIGMLSALYRYGAIAYIGGGFSRGGIHNMLEPAVYGLPEMMGPNFQKFVEARKLTENGFAFPASNEAELKETFLHLKTNAPALAPAIRNFIKSNAGATSKAVDWLLSVLKK